MFVRWQHRTKTRRVVFGRGQAGDVRWSAILVESIWIDGRPRQRHIANLGSCVEQENTPVHRAEFWKAVTSRLDRLGNKLTAGDRKKIEAAIARKVRRPRSRRRSTRHSANVGDAPGRAGDLNDKQVQTAQ
jgi:hypothetical protein